MRSLWSAGVYLFFVLDWGVGPLNISMSPPLVGIFSGTLEWMLPANRRFSAEPLGKPERGGDEMRGDIMGDRDRKGHVQHNLYNISSSSFIQGFFKRIPWTRI